MRITQIPISERKVKDITRQDILKAGVLVECFKRYTTLSDDDMENIIEAQLKRKMVENADYRWYIYNVFCKAAKKAGMGGRWKYMTEQFKCVDDEDDFKTMVLLFAMLMNEKIGDQREQSDFDNGYITAMYTEGSVK